MLKRIRFFLSSLVALFLAINVSIAHAENGKQFSDATTFDPTEIALTAASNVAYGAGVPVGTVVAWPYASLPNGTTQSICTGLASEGDSVANSCEWLICDGSTIKSTAYPALARIVGTSLPNLKGRFLEGANGVVRQFKNAGLPDFQGRVKLEDPYATGVFRWLGTKSSGEGSSGGDYDVEFRASYYNAIYGASHTVQPASYTVNYLIKAY